MFFGALVHGTVRNQAFAISLDKIHKINIIHRKFYSLPAGLEPTLYGLEDRCFIH